MEIIIGAFLGVTIFCLGRWTMEKEEEKSD